MHSDASAPLVDLVWYETDLPFIETESAINSNDWDEEPWRDRTVGEQYGYSRNYNGRKKPAGATGTHQCGTAFEFANGADWPYLGPPVVYLPNGLPACCETPDIEVVTAGGRPASVVVRPYLRYARVTGGGRPASVLLGSETRPATVTGGGRPASVLLGSETRPATVTGGGRPASVLTSTSSRAATVTGGGRPASVLLGSETRPATVTGGGRPASVLTSTSSRAATVTGGGRPASVVVPPPYLDPVEGGVMMGGEIADAFTPGTPSPGTSCADAGVIDLGTEYGGLSPASPLSAWWQFTAPTDGTYHVDATGVDGVTTHLAIYDTTFCPIVGELVPSVVGPPCWEFTALAGNQYAVVFFSDDGGEAYTFTADVGEC